MKKKVNDILKGVAGAGIATSLGHFLTFMVGVIFYLTNKKHCQQIT